VQNARNGKEFACDDVVCAGRSPLGPPFDRLMNVLFDDCAFAQAVTIGYHGDVRSLWQKFIESISGRK